MTTNKSILIALVFTIMCVAFTSWYSRAVSYTDFPILYNSASYFLKENNALEDIYDIWISHTYHLPEATHQGKFIYSPLALILLSPLGYLDYYTAKTVLMSLNIMCYVVSIFLILNYLKLSGRWFVYPFFLSFIWAPFLMDVMFGQINSILLLLITFAIYAIRNKSLLFSGSLIGIAASFKLFPIGIAMTLGIRSFRVLLGCALFSICLLTLPGALKWFTAIQNNPFIELSPAYLLLGQLNPHLGYLYSAIIGFITALVIYIFDVNEPLKIVSFSIPAIFLAAPVIEYYHLTLLIIPYFFLISYAKDNQKLINILIPLLSFSIISFTYFWNALDYITKREINYISIFLLWLVFANIFSSDATKSDISR